MSIRSGFLTMLALALSVTVAHGQDEKKGKKRKKNIDPVLAQQLRSVFDTMDGDKDGYLDKTELAVAFRGRGAKPAPDVDPDDEDEKKPAKPPVNTPLYTDAVFLNTYDDNKDGKLSFAEFEDAGVTYNNQMKKGIEQARKADIKALQRFRRYQRGAFGNSPIVGPWEAMHKLMRQQAAQQRKK